jgi:hypothetical protein
MPRILEQKGNNDCGIAALAMYYDKDYNEVLNTYLQRIRNQILPQGIYNQEIPKLSALLGRKLKQKSGLPQGKSVVIIKVYEKDCSDQGTHKISYYHAPLPNT